MKEKNRFSHLLEYLFKTGGIKHTAIAEKLQYDVSYISKWTSGSLLPSERNSEKVIGKISHYVPLMSSEQGLKTLMADYQVEHTVDLERAVYDHLQIEYSYIREHQMQSENAIVPKVSFSADMSLPQYIAKMNHPVLRRVSSLEVMAALDLMAIAHEYRLQIVQIGKKDSLKQWNYPDVHFSLLINLEYYSSDCIYDTVFLLSMLTEMTHIDFKLYSSVHAGGRLIFAVKNDFAISGMLVGDNRAISVIDTEDKETSNVLYYNIAEMCSNEMLLLRKITMKEMLSGGNYAHSLLSLHPRWLLGRMTEHFLSDELFEEVVLKLVEECKSDILVEVLRNIHMLTRNMLEKSSVQIMFYVDAFTDLAVSNELDFFNYKVHLTPEQRVTYMNHLLDILENYNNLEIKLIYGQLVSDSRYRTGQCIFLSDTFSYLRLDIDNSLNNLFILNRVNIREVFDRFFVQAWGTENETVISDKTMILEFIRHIIHGISLIPKV